MKFLAFTIGLLTGCYLWAAQPVKEIEIRYTDGTKVVVAVPATTSPTQPPTTIWVKVQPAVGLNLTGLNDWDPSKVFADIMKSARKAGSTTKPYDENAPRDVEGWGTGACGYTVLTGMPKADGIYKVRYVGNAKMTARGAKLQGLTYDTAKNTTTGELVITANAIGGYSLDVHFDARATNVEIIRPGYNFGDTFTREFLALVQPFTGGFRFMDWARTNNSTVVTWADRVEPSNATWRDGVPWEMCFELGKKLNRSVWINVPAMADDAYVVQLGDLLRKSIPATGPPIYVEYSNEVWNGQFKQFQQNLDAAVAEVAAGDRSLTNGGTDTNKYFWAWRRVAKRSVEIKRLLGDHPQIRLVLASQVGYAPGGYVLKQQLEYVEKFHGPPSKFFFAVAQAPYFSPGKLEDGKTHFTSVAGITAQQIASRLLERSESVRTSDKALAFHTLSQKYGLHSFGYEGGVDLQQFQNDIPAKVASQYLPEAGQAVERYLNAWNDGGGEVIFYFNACSSYGRYGYWGLTENVLDLSSDKYQGAMRAAKTASTRPAR
jgi:hypothetical protein